MLHTPLCQLNQIIHNLCENWIQVTQISLNDITTESHFFRGGFRVYSLKRVTYTVHTNQAASMNFNCVQTKESCRIENRILAT